MDPECIPGTLDTRPEIHPERYARSFQSTTHTHTHLHTHAGVVYHSLLGRRKQEIQEETHTEHIVTPKSSRILKLTLHTGFTEPLFPLNLIPLLFPIISSAALFLPFIFFHFHFYSHSTEFLSIFLLFSIYPTFVSLSFTFFFLSQHSFFFFCFLFLTPRLCAFSFFFSDDRIYPAC